MSKRRTLPLWKDVTLTTVHGERMSKMVMMDPMVFIRLTVRGSAGLQELLAREPADGRTLDDRSEYSRHGMPYLIVEPVSGRVLDHDGRHRCAMVARAGGHAVPVAIYFREPSVWILDWMNIGMYFGSYQERFAWGEELDARMQELEAGGGKVVCVDRRCQPGRMLHSAGRDGYIPMPSSLIGQYDQYFRACLDGCVTVNPKHQLPQ